MTIREHLLLSIGLEILEREGKFAGVTSTIQSSSYSRVLQFLPPHYPKKNFYALLLELERSGFVKRGMFGREPTVRLTPESIELLSWRYGHVGLSGKPWDGKWRIILYDIKEKDRYKREKIRTIIGQFGYASLHPSVYLTPHATAEALQARLAQEGLVSSAFFFTADQSQLGDSRVLADRIWRLHTFVERYQDLLRRLHIVLGQQVPERRRAGVRRIRSDFIRVIADDPLLPAELLPSDWPIARVFTTLNEVKNRE